MGPPAGVSSGGLRASDDPTYVQGRNRSELLAHFRSGTSVQVECGRRRRYPGLAGPAPPTHACYRKFVELGHCSRQLLDVGCGAGLGLRWLLQSGLRVTGLDIDGKAVAFAREFTPDVELLHADIQSSRVDFPGAAVLVVDLLGLLSDPVQLLRSIRHRVPRLEALYVAEPIADHEQTLIPPARRAFGIAALKSLFARSGFDFDDCVTVEGGMLCALGHPMRDPAGNHLVLAEQAYLSHQTQAFLAACQRVRQSTSPELCLEVALLEARLWFDLGQLDRSIAVLSHAGALAPRDPRPLAGLSRLALASGSQEHAIRLAEAAVATEPTDLAAVCSVALAYVGANTLRSFGALKTANALAPDDPSIARTLCAAALAEGRHNDGLAIMDRLAQYPGRISALDEYLGQTVLAAVPAKRLR